MVTADVVIPLEVARIAGIAACVRCAFPRCVSALPRTPSCAAPRCRCGGRTSSPLPLRPVPVLLLVLALALVLVLAIGTAACAASPPLRASAPPARPWPRRLDVAATAASWPRRRHHGRSASVGGRRPASSRPSVSGPPDTTTGQASVLLGGAAHAVETACAASRPVARAHDDACRRRRTATLVDCTVQDRDAARQASSMGCAEEEEDEDRRRTARLGRASPSSTSSDARLPGLWAPSAVVRARAARAWSLAHPAWATARGAGGGTNTGARARGGGRALAC